MITVISAEVAAAFRGATAWVATHPSWIVWAVLGIVAVSGVRALLAPSRWRLERAMTVALLLLVSARRIAFDPEDGQPLVRDGENEWGRMPQVLADQLDSYGGGDLWVAPEPVALDDDGQVLDDDGEFESWQEDPCVAYLVLGGRMELDGETDAGRPGVWEQVRESVGV